VIARPRSGLIRALTLLLHVILAVTVSVWAVRLELPAPWGLVAPASVAAPLLLGVPGLLTPRRGSYSRVAVLLVAYVGGSVVEVVASQRSTWPPVAALVTSLAELLLVLALIRTHPPASGG